MQFEKRQREYSPDTEEKVDDLYQSTGCSNVKWTAWELDFIENIHDQIEEGKTLTSGQRTKVNEIWDKL